MYYIPNLGTTFITCEIVEPQTFKHIDLYHNR